MTRGHILKLREQTLCREEGGRQADNTSEPHVSTADLLWELPQEARKMLGLVASAPVNRKGRIANQRLTRTRLLKLDPVMGVTGGDSLYL